MTSVVVSRAQSIVRQGAMTSKLMGVDFVPVYRRSGASDVAPPTSEVEPKPDAPAAILSEPDPAELFVGERRPKPTDRSASAAALDKIRERYEAEAPHQHFVTDHHSIVFHDGDPCARLMFIGEAPGADEDREGIPFVGRAGQLLNKMIVAMGLRREDVYIANVLKTRPPNNATPTIEEARLCAPYLFEQIAVVQPEVIVTLGLPATRLLLSSEQSMGALRGRWAEFRYKDVVVPVLPTYHPAFLLRSYTKENREKVWSDLQKVIVRLGLTPQRAAPVE